MTIRFDPTHPGRVAGREYAPSDVAATLRALQAKGATLAVAESCTGGQIAARLTAVAGASAVVRGGVVAYDNALKHKDTYGIRQVLKPVLQHGVYSFYMEDRDHNWWEIQCFDGFQHDDMFDFGDDLDEWIESVRGATRVIVERRRPITLRHHLAVTLNHKTWLAVYKLAQKAELSFSAYCRKLIEDAVAG